MKVNNNNSPKEAKKSVKSDESQNIKKLVGEVEVERDKYEYRVYFKDYEGQSKSLSWFSHNLYGKELSDGGNIKANSSGYWKNRFRIWEPNSFLSSWKMRVSRYDGWGKPWTWSVNIGTENVKKLVETERADRQKELKRLAWHIVRAKEENKRQELVSDYNYLAESLSVAKIEISTK